MNAVKFMGGIHTLSKNLPEYSRIMLAMLCMVCISEVIHNACHNDCSRLTRKLQANSNPGKKVMRTWNMPPMK